MAFHRFICKNVVYQKNAAGRHALLIYDCLLHRYGLSVVFMSSDLLLMAEVCVAILHTCISSRSFPRNFHFSSYFVHVPEN